MGVALLTAPPAMAASATMVNANQVFPRLVTLLRTALAVGAKAMSVRVVDTATVAVSTAIVAEEKRTAVLAVIQPSALARSVARRPLLVPSQKPRLPLPALRPNFLPTIAAALGTVSRRNTLGRLAPRGNVARSTATVELHPPRTAARRASRILENVTASLRLYAVRPPSPQLSARRLLPLLRSARRLCPLLVSDPHPCHE